MYQQINDYGIIGNLRTIALVSSCGSIDWLCLPALDSPSVFAALLDDRIGGRFQLRPEGDTDSVQVYRPQTNVLTTRFRRQDGSQLELTDFMPIPNSEDDAGTVYRRIEVLKGKMRVKLIFEPKFDYARAETRLERHPGGLVASSDGGQSLALYTGEGMDLTIDDGRAQGWLNLSKGNSRWLKCQFGRSEVPVCDRDTAEQVLEDTTAFWHTWLNTQETGREHDLGPNRAMIERSALILKLLHYQPSGAIAAAATTSLPEEIAGVRNWDYRYTWIRDTALTLQALYDLGHLSELEGYFKWIKKVIRESGADLKIMYGLRGQTELPEIELEHLEGYKGSAPVRIGNAAEDQLQLDIYGEIMDAALKLSNYAGKIDIGLWNFLKEICDYVTANWQNPDSGIWEVRGGPYHFVQSKVMCWVALDRGLTIARRYGFPADRELWRQTADDIRKDVLERGWCEAKKAFVQHYETDALDAANLLIPIFGFLPFDDPRVRSNADAIRRELGHPMFDGYLLRYQGDDGLPGEEGVFLICSFWLVDNLIGRGDLREAAYLLERLREAASPLGLFAEEYDPHWREALGNYPQAFSHVGFIISVMTLSRKRASRDRRPPEKPLAKVFEHKALIFRSYLLNDGDPPGDASTEMIAADLKHRMNILRGAFFRVDEGRVAYEEMKGSQAYRRYLSCSYALKRFDIGSLETRAEKLAFWINLYNVIVINGVIELGIRNSVKEVPRFFRRVCYRVGEETYSADDIEHGILRGNRRFPLALRDPFPSGDPRRKHAIGEIDPRIHFALVCASVSCPPIELYTADNLDDELDISGRTFLNAGGIQIDREAGKIYLSRVFKWYGEDFGRTTTGRLRFLAPYLYSDEDRAYIEERAAELTVSYQDYDWRLNRI
jgi:GH15 family glucan-1,4-alpha-glucosidase